MDGTRTYKKYYKFSFIRELKFHRQTAVEVKKANAVLGC